jgi:hypothetical protein
VHFRNISKQIYFESGSIYGMRQEVSGSWKKIRNSTLQTFCLPDRMPLAAKPHTLSIRYRIIVIKHCNSRYKFTAWISFSVSQFHEKETYSYPDTDNFVSCDLLFLR